MKTIMALMASLLIFSCNSKQEKTEVSAPTPTLPVLNITPESVTTYQEYPASIEGIESLEIRPQISGILDQVYIDEGQFVKAGSPLFKINEASFRAALNNAEASLHAAQGTMINADLEVEKLTPLFQNKVVSEFQLKAAKTSSQIAEANVEQAKANISAAKINLGYTIIKAPVSGFAGRLQRKRGSLVSPTDTEPITQLSDVHNVHVYFSLTEKEFVTFKDQYSGQTLVEKLNNLPPVTLSLANNKIYSEKGRVDAIDGQFDKNTGAITLRANFSNPQGLLRAGNTGKIQLGLYNSDVLLVPQSATMETQDKMFVFVLADSNKVKKQPITIFGRSGDKYLVKEGLKAGDRVVTDGIVSLAEGTTINPKTTPDKAVSLKN
ncbi:efflux RND transporter periplasmic adaptor subunit [Dyadobacter subterraneus]|uniref:Efflux RND transporter periplasmic adaptor subunit n=1 Tax=Dyadobacter subterraneus TaxID=2773304 RepID=A0ABR9WMK7_9BACT|nr:efflux RND transporter periplasmic adaptor subunit [Dyadobacter subterraneus]MBE9466645.1 efflux RND transporter periplasmic adaptor subunit [Dyadobacter subterraneus]